MSKEQKIEGIITSMKSFGKEAYRKAEVVPELFKLQEEAVKAAFGEDEYSPDMRIWDVEKRLAERNQAAGNVVDEELASFKLQCKEMCCTISGEMSGKRGEDKAIRSLATLGSPCRVLRNVELKHGEVRSEVDALAITRKSCTIVEVKNTRKDVHIDSSGSYFRVGDCSIYDSNIGLKTRDREYLVGEALNAAGFSEMPLMSIVVFTDSRITVTNEYERLQACFLSELPYLIEESDLPDIYTASDINAIAEAVESARCQEAYPVKFDAARFKHDLAYLLVTLDEAESRELETTEKDSSATKPNERRNRGRLARRLIPRLAAAAFSGVAVAAAIAAGNDAA